MLTAGGLAMPVLQACGSASPVAPRAVVNVVTETKIGRIISPMIVRKYPMNGMSQQSKQY